MHPANLTWRGPPIDDPNILEHAPANLRALLERINGFILFRGGLHVRGACQEPTWHCLRWAWRGDGAFHFRYPELQPDDVPFGQDCVGDQFLLRGGWVIQLKSETGDVDPLGISLEAFLESAQASPVEVLGLHPLLQFQQEGGSLLPGQLLSVYPPFCTEESALGVSFQAIPALDRLSFLGELAQQFTVEE